MKRIIFFLASPIGRMARLVVGFLLIAGAWLAPTTTVQFYGLAAFGVVMMLASLADVCLLAPLIGLSVSDELLRDQASRRGKLQ